MPCISKVIRLAKKVSYVKPKLRLDYFAWQSRQAKQMSVFGNSFKIAGLTAKP